MTLTGSRSEAPWLVTVKVIRTVTRQPQPCSSDRAAARATGTVPRTRDPAMVLPKVEPL